MLKTFNVLTKIEITDEQNMAINLFINTVKKYDINNEVTEICLSLANVTNGHLNEEFAPIIVTTEKFFSDELYEGVKADSSLIPEYVWDEHQLPARVVTLWKRDSF